MGKDHVVWCVYVCANDASAHPGVVNHPLWFQWTHTMLSVHIILAWHEPNGRVYQAIHYGELLLLEIVGPWCKSAWHLFLDCPGLLRCSPSRIIWSNLAERSGIPVEYPFVFWGMKGVCTKINLGTDGSNSALISWIQYIQGERWNTYCYWLLVLFGVENKKEHWKVTKNSWVQSPKYSLSRCLELKDAKGP